MISPLALSSSSRRIKGSAFFDGGTKYLTMPGAAHLAPGTGDFTVEWFQYALPFDDNFTRIFQVGPWPSKFGFSLENAGLAYIWTTGLSSPLFSFSPDPYRNKWVWFAMSRTGGFLHVFQDGKLKYRASNSDNMNDSANDFCIGIDNGYTATTRYKGYISNFRYILGEGLYSGASVGTQYYNVPNTPLSVTANTRLMLYMDKGRITTDSSGYNTVTNSGGLTHSII